MHDFQLEQNSKTPTVYMAEWNIYKTHFIAFYYFMYLDILVSILKVTKRRTNSFFLIKVSSYMFGKILLVSLLVIFST